MAEPAPANIVARRVTDYLIDFSGETAPSKYTSFFLDQKLAETRRFVNRMRGEVDSIRECLAQTTSFIAELQASPNQVEVRDSLLGAKDAKRSEQSMLMVLHEVIAEALEGIGTLETNVNILDGENDGD